MFANGFCLEDHFCKFDIESDYEVVKEAIGSGSYGIVCSARSKVSGEMVAIKKIPKAFTHSLTDAKRILREVVLLRRLDHPNIIKVKDILKPKDFEQFEDIYIAFELMDTDLQKIISSPQVITDKHVQYFLYQILKAIKYLHSAHILHRDLKPSNLLVNANCKLKICDFGLARVYDEEEDKTMTKYVVTRWYRAPELLMQSSEYTKSIDMWSVGCIFAEMLGRKPLFPGKDYIHQINCIIGVVGTPSEQDLTCISNKDACNYIRSLPRKNKLCFQKLYPYANPAALDLLERLLHFNPQKRCTVEEAISHPYLKDLHDPLEEPLATNYSCYSAVDEKEMTREQVKKLIYQEMLVYHPEEFGLKGKQ